MSKKIQSIALLHHILLYKVQKLEIEQPKILPGHVEIGTSSPLSTLLSHLERGNQRKAGYLAKLVCCNQYSSMAEASFNLYLYVYTSY